MSEHPEPYDGRIAELLRRYADSVVDEPASGGARPRRSRSAKSVHRSVRAAALVVLLVFAGGIGFVAAATAGGIIGFGTPRMAPGSPAPATPHQPIGTPTVAGEVRSGWVFVVDEPDVALNAEVLLLDPMKNQVAARYPTGYDPVIAVAPSGERLYIASSEEGRSWLRAFDPRSGDVVLQVPFDDRAMNTLPPLRSSLVVSLDGRWVFGSVLRIISPGKDENALATFDTVAGEWLDEVRLPGCMAPFLVPAASGVDLVCGHDGRVISVNVADGQPAISGQVRADPGVRGVIRVDEGDLLVVTDDGELKLVQRARGRVESTGRGPTDGEVWPGAMLGLHGTDQVLIGSRDNLDQQGAVTLRVMTRGGSVSAARDFRVPIWSVAASPDGTRVYATAAGSLLVLDAQLNEVAQIDAGTFLAQPIVAP